MKSSAELENMLLQVAGRGGSGSHKYKNQHRSSYSSSDSDPEPTTNTRKKMKMPLKKRHHSSSESDRESVSGGSFGSDLYKDDDDKEQLGKLSELDREMILAERGTRRDDYRLKKMAASKAPPSASTREKERVGSASKRTADKSSTRTAALQGLRDRMHKKDPERFRNHYKHLAGGDAHERSPPSTRHRGSSPPPLGEGDNEGRNNDSDHNDDELPEDSPRMQPIKYEDIKEITILRSRLLKWFMDPFFEDLLPGCFVRVGIHQHKDGRRKYRLYMVRSVDASDPDRTYKFEHYTTYKYLILVTRSESSVDKCKMAEVSDSPPTENEFEEWLQLAESNKMQIPDRQELLEKKEAIQKALNFVYSAETVKHLLLEKKLASLRPANVAAEKDRLRKELEVARARHDEAEADRMLARLKQLEQMQPKQTDSKAARLAEMNRRNRAENFMNASEMKPVNIGLKSGEAGYDPFSRRWTRSRNYYMSKPDGEGSAANAETEGGVKEEVKGVAETAAAQEAAAGAGKLVDTKAVADPGTAMYQLHNFEVHIDLTKLQQLGSTPAERVFRGRLLRRQRQEISIGRKLPESDGKRHPLTLSVSDYKRRRGLL